jgi:hypothetical protein
VLPFFPAQLPRASLDAIGCCSSDALRGGSGPAGAGEARGFPRTRQSIAG